VIGVGPFQEIALRYELRSNPHAFLRLLRRHGLTPAGFSGLGQIAELGSLCLQSPLPVKHFDVMQAQSRARPRYINEIAPTVVADDDSVDAIGSGQRRN
jgi:hypothetical protein